MKSNCLIQAVRRYSLLLKKWRSDGKISGGEPYFIARPSRFNPKIIPHFLVGKWNSCKHCGGGIQVTSYVPINGEDVPLLQFYKHLIFRGKWINGDNWNN